MMREIGGVLQPSRLLATGRPAREVARATGGVRAHGGARGDRREAGRRARLHDGPRDAGSEAPNAGAHGTATG